jgi:lipoyl(octanoyl) transferase
MLKVDMTQVTENIAYRQSVSYRELGLISYKEAWDLQEALFQETISIKIDNRSATPATQHDTQHQLLLCEHPPVVTLGKNANINNLLIPENGSNGVEVFHINRGGDVTFHGPGQLVGYPILDLDRIYTDIGRYLRDLEECIIQVLADYQLKGERLPGATGVWLDSENPYRARKICAMGIRCSRWVTMHGFAFNINTNLDYFNLIIPCGISDKAVTSLEKELGRQVDMQEIRERFLGHFSRIFNLQIIPLDG